MIARRRSHRNIRTLACHIPVAFCSAIYLSLERRRRSARVEHPERGGERDVDLALKLNVLAVFAVFAFVGAILLGAF
jgi:hypothetical protein